MEIREEIGATPVGGNEDLETLPQSEAIGHVVLEAAEIADPCMPLDLSKRTPEERESLPHIHRRTRFIKYMLEEAQDETGSLYGDDLGKKICDDLGVKPQRLGSDLHHMAKWGLVEFERDVYRRKYTRIQVFKAKVAENINNRRLFLLDDPVLDRLLVDGHPEEQIEGFPYQEKSEVWNQDNYAAYAIELNRHDPQKKVRFTSFGEEISEVLTLSRAEYSALDLKWKIAHTAATELNGKIFSEPADILEALGMITQHWLQDLQKALRELTDKKYMHVLAGEGQFKLTLTKNGSHNLREIIKNI